MTTYRARRLAAGCTMIRAAVLAEVGVGTVRVFELDPTEVRDLRKRLALLRVYDAFARPAPAASMSTH